MGDENVQSGEQERLSFAAPLRAIEAISVDNSAGVLSLKAMKKIDAADPHLAGHFPNLTIFPGVFIIEGLRQMIALAMGESNGLMPDILTLRSVRFLAPVFPNDLITLHAIVGPSSRGRSFDVDARCERSDGVTVARLRGEFGYGSDSDA
jgi:3-hydroxyacyl-[acyl-carrier-protein] dehydratase